MILEAQNWNGNLENAISDFFNLHSHFFLPIVAIESNWLLNRFLTWKNIWNQNLILEADRLQCDRHVCTIHMTKIMPLVGNPSSKNSQVDGLIKLWRRVNEIHFKNFSTSVVASAQCCQINIGNQGKIFFLS